MTVTEKIIEAVRDGRLTGAQIITQIDGNPKTVKSLLHRLVNAQRILRTKEAVRSGRGPQQVFVYYAAGDNAQQESSRQVGSSVRTEGGYPSIYR